MVILEQIEMEIYQEEMAFSRPTLQYCVSFSTQFPRRDM